MIKHMKRCIFTKVKFMALFLFAVLMTACTADVYEPKPDPDQSRDRTRVQMVFRMILIIQQRLAIN